MVFPRVTVEMALGSAPLATSPTWTDITGDVARVETKRGRQHELGQMQAGTCDLTIPAHRFVDYLRWNTASPYYGNLLTADQSDFENSVSEWAAIANCSLAASNAFASHGSYSLEVQAGASGSFSFASSVVRVPVIAGKIYTPSLQMRSLEHAATITTTVRFFDAISGGSSTGTITGGGPVVVGGSFTQIGGISVTAPAGSVGADIFITGIASSAGDHFYVDQAQIAAGTSTAWVVGGQGGLVRPMVKTRVKAEWNLLTLDQSDFEASLGGWANNGNASVSRTSAVAVDSWSMQLQAVANGNMSAIMPNGQSGAYVGWNPRGAYTAMAYFRAASAPRLCDVSIFWYDAGGGSLGGNTGTAIADTVGGWTQVTVTVANPPSGAYYAAVGTRIQSCVATEIHYVDQVALLPGPNITTWARGGPLYLFTGYVESFQPRQQDVTTGTMAIHAVDGFKFLSLAKLVSTAYRDAVLADSLTAYYRMAENVNGVTSGTHPAVVDASGNGNVGQYFGSPTFAAISPLVAEVDTAVDFGVRQSYVLLNTAATPSGSSAFTIEAWVWPRSLPVTTFGDQIWSAQTSSNEQLHLYLKSNGTLRFFVGAGGDTGYVESSVALTLSAWSHVVAVRAAGAPSGWRIYINGVDVTTGATIDTGTGDPSLPVSTSMIAGKDTGGGIDTPAFDGKIDEFAVYIGTALSAGRVAAHFDAAFGFAVNSLAGARINNLLDIGGWPAADRVIDAGQFQMQPITTSLQTTSSLAVAMSLVESEGFPAALFVDGQGRVVFQDRAHATPASAATVGDGAGELHPASYPTWQPDLDDLDLWNEIVLQANNGVAKTADDPASQTAYLKRTLSKTGLLNASDSDVQTLATAELARYKDPQVRLKGMTIRPTGDPGNLYPQVLGRELNDRIAANQHTFAGAATALTLDQRIEGIEHTIDFQTGDWTTQWQQVPT